MSKQDQGYYGIPAAYKVHREDRYKDKKVRKRGPKRQPRRNKGGDNHNPIPNHNPNPMTAASSSNKTDYKSFTEAKSYGHDSKNFSSKKFVRLQEIEDEVKEMQHRYGEALGTSPSDASRLVETEDLYRKICIKLRQLVAGWSRIRHYGTGQWSKKDVLPPQKAEKYLALLERMRRKRSQYITASLEKERLDKPVAKPSTGMFQWFADKFNGDSVDGKDLGGLSCLESLEQLTAHESEDFTANARLYDSVLNSYGHFWRDFIPDKELTVHLENVFTTMEHNIKRGSPNVKLDRKIYHRLMADYQGSARLINAKKSALRLNEMLEKTRDDVERGDTPLCQPTHTTYNIVLSNFFKAVQELGNNVDAKLEAVTAAEGILTLMEKEGLTTLGGVDAEEIESSDDEYESWPYHTMLLTLVAAGPEILPDYLERVDALMTRMMGEDAYQQLLCDNGDLVDTSKIDHRHLQGLVHAYTSTGKRDVLDKAKIVLKKMEDTRVAFLAQEDSKDISWHANYPICISYNSVILGLFHCKLNADDGSLKLDKESSPNVATINDAVYATSLLDSMVQRKSSLPNPLTYYRLIRIWKASNSKEAGRRAEEILSRLEMHLAFTGDRSSARDLDMRLKQSVLECWAVSAAAGEPGAARRASMLLNRVNERLARENCNDEKNLRDKGFLYMAVIRACADTVVEADKADALQIAFDMYNMIVEEGISPTPYTFVQLMRCCQLVAPSAHDQVLNLSREVFQAACSNGCVNRYVLFLLRQLNYHLYEAYEKKPEHSVSVATKGN